MRVCAAAIFAAGGSRGVSIKLMMSSVCGSISLKMCWCGGAVRRNGEFANAGVLYCFPFVLEIKRPHDQMQKCIIVQEFFIPFSSVAIAYVCLVLTGCEVFAQ